VPVGERRPERAAGVAGRGLDPEVVEDALAQELAVGDAVERHAAGEAEVALAGHRARPPRQLRDRFLRHLLDRAREVHLAAGDARLRRPRRAAEEGGEAVVGHHQAVEVAEVVHVEAEGAVLAQVDQLAADGVGEARLAVGREPHQLVLAGVDLEAGEVGEGRVEEPERVRELDLLEDLQPLALADADRRRRPLADAVEGEHRRLGEGRGVEGGGGVRLVVGGEVDGRRLGDAAGFERLGDARRDPELLLEPERHRLDEGGEAARRHRQVGLEDAVELEQRLVVEDDPVQAATVAADPPRLQAVAHRAGRETGVVLEPRETLLLRRRDDAAVLDQAGGRVVVVAGDAEELHVAAGLRTAGGRPRGRAGGPGRRRRGRSNTSRRPGRSRW
jgi:hypothetical protein